MAKNKEKEAEELLLGLVQKAEKAQSKGRGRTTLYEHKRKTLKIRIVGTVLIVLVLILAGAVFGGFILASKGHTEIFETLAVATFLSILSGLLSLTIGFFVGANIGD